MAQVASEQDFIIVNTPQPQLWIFHVDIAVLPLEVRFWPDTLNKRGLFSRKE
jgi:hypothetical protein